MGDFKHAVLIRQYAGPHSCEAMQRIFDHDKSLIISGSINVFALYDKAMKVACQALC